MAKATARHILIRNEQQCLAVKEQILAGLDFAQAAIDYSNCPSGQSGGLMGEFGPGHLVKQFDEVIFSADLNTVHGPVKTNFGYHLLEITSRED